MKSRNRICSSGPKTVIVQALVQSSRSLRSLESQFSILHTEYVFCVTTKLQTAKTCGRTNRVITAADADIYRWVPLQYCPSCRLSSWRVAGSCALSAWTHPRGRSSQQSALHGQELEVETWNMEGNMERSTRGRVTGSMKSAKNTRNNEIKLCRKIGSTHKLIPQE